MAICVPCREGGELLTFTRLGDESDGWAPDEREALIEEINRKHAECKGCPCQHRVS